MTTHSTGIAASIDCSAGVSIGTSRLSGIPTNGSCARSPALRGQTTSNNTEATSALLVEIGARRNPQMIRPYTSIAAVSSVFTQRRVSRSIAYTSRRLVSRMTYSPSRVARNCPYSPAADRLSHDAPSHCPGTCSCRA